MKKLFAVIALSVGSSAMASSLVGDHGSELSSAYELAVNKKMKEAVDVLEKARKKSPDNYAINFRLGYLYNASGITANAIEHYSTALKAEPNSLEAMIGLMNANAAKANWSDAVSTANKILEMAPLNYSACWNLVRGRIMMTQYSEASATVEKCLKAFPTDQTLLVQKASALAGAKKNQEAISAYKDVVALYPNDVASKAALKELK